MKVKAEKEKIIQILQKVQLAVGVRTTLPVLSNILFKADGGKLSVSGTDLDLSIRSTMDAKVGAKGGITMPAKRIVSIVRDMPGSELDIEVDEKDAMAIRSGQSFFKVLGISEDEFPPLPNMEGGKTYAMEQGVLQEMIRNTSYAMASDESRQVLNGLLLSFRDGKFAVVATDGRRMALYEHEMAVAKGEEGDYVIPPRAVSALQGILQTKGSVKIIGKEKMIGFETDDTLIVSKLVEGTYPNYRQVLPSQSDLRIVMERESLLDALHRVSLIFSDLQGSVKLTFENNRLTIVGITTDVGEAVESMAVKYSGKAITIAFNPQFMMDPLKNLTADEVIMELTDDLSPGVIKANLPFAYVLMPVRLN